MQSKSDTVIELLQAAGRGSHRAVDQLLPVVYDELRGLAAAFLCRERSDHTLQPTALVHEAYLRLVGQRTVGWQNRTHFFAAAATIMRRILVDYARARKAVKRGNGRAKLPLDDFVAAFEERALDLVGLDEALNRLAMIDERKSRVVELRFFGGLTVRETSRYLDVPTRTIEREWTMAKAWLRGQLQRRNG